jgi:hypothetical protein
MKKYRFLITYNNFTVQLFITSKNAVNILSCRDYEVFYQMAVNIGKFSGIVENYNGVNYQLDKM